ncbi:MAG TPA: hypothetical protein VK399_01415 [Longimicrobiaceae bacterium]|nr:hypothetical protein [Longimicrobiaceae bacterium]
MEVLARDLPDACFLPGVRVDRGRLLVDEARLLYPGDLLHEAGHVAIMPAAERGEREGDVGADLDEEIGAIAWSYAAAVHLELDPAVVFHAHGYRGALGASSTTSTTGATWASRSCSGWTSPATRRGRARRASRCTRTCWSGCATDRRPVGTAERRNGGASRYRRN